MSRPLQVYLDEADLQKLEAWAASRGWTKSQAIRAAVRALTRSPQADPLLAASGMIDGLPVGLMLIGKHWDEPTIYKAAYAFEQAGDWKAM